MSNRTVKVDIVYFSWTGNTRKVVDIISQELSKHAKINVTQITPKRNYPYFIWLFLSFLPNIGVAFEGGHITSDIVFICMPKWTFNCPPITAYLKKNDLKGRFVYLVITYGGFDEKRYAASYKSKIGKICKEVKDFLLVKRSKIVGDDANEIKDWMAKIMNDVKKL